MQDPLRVPVVLSSWTTQSLDAQSSHALFGVADRLLRSAPAPVSLSSGSVVMSGFAAVPEGLKEPVRRLAQALVRSQSLLKKSLADLSPRERDDILRLNEFPVHGHEASDELEQSPEFKKRVFASLSRFDQDSLLEASDLLTRAVDGEMENLRNWSAQASSGSAPVRVGTPAGEIWIAGTGNDRYDAQSLSSGPALLIDAGGDNAYEGPAAAAGPGQIRVVVDFGRNVTVVSTGSDASAGAGIFGIGLMYLPDPAGRKTIVSGSFSQGAGLCGVGGLFLSGPGLFLAQNDSQGGGFFGAGIFSNRSAEGAEYRANRYAQGIGFTRGVGIFRHEGSGATLEAGLTDPDPREPLGRVSLCQGVGYGPRAYAAGGVGICALRGDRLRLESSYFAQGAGYWHAAGAFLLEGSSSSLKARRYDQGSGVHCAVGGFFLTGDDDHVVNWGVGPAYGWDQSAGWAMIWGDRNRVQAEWSAGMAAVNGSRSFLSVRGDDNRMDLPGLGGSQMSRDFPDYSLAVIRGRDNRLRLPSLKTARLARGTVYATPWGAVILENVALSSSVGLSPQEWPRLPQELRSTPETKDWTKELREAKTLPAEQRTGKLLEIAAAFTTDRATPRDALAALISSDEHLPSLARRVDPADFDGFIQLRVALSFFGDAAADPLVREIRAEKDSQRRAYLLTLLSFVGVRHAVPVLLENLSDPDWRIEATAGRVLGSLLDRDRGDLPGRTYILGLMRDWLSSGSSEQEEKLVPGLASMPYADACSLFSLAGLSGPGDRAILLDAAPSDINSVLEAAGARKLLQALSERREAALRKVSSELEDSASAEPEVRKAFTRILSGAPPRKEVIHAALAGLGHIGRPEDARLCARFLRHSSALVREEAAAALGRIGRPAFPELRKALRSPRPRDRMQAVLAADRTVAPELLGLIEAGLKDPNPQVRLESLAAVPQIQTPLSERRKRLLEKTGLPPAGTLLRGLDLEKVWLFGD